MALSKGLFYNQRIKAPKCFNQVIQLVLKGTRQKEVIKIKEAVEPVNYHIGRKRLNTTYLQRQTFLYR